MEVCRIQEACYRAGRGNAYLRDPAWKAATARRNASASPVLRAEWKFWQEAGRKYGFGRIELLPIRSTAEGVAHYVGKYIGKHIEQRDKLDKGVRLVSYSKGVAAWGCNFGWVSPGADVYREKLGLLADALGVTPADYVKDSRTKRVVLKPFVEWFGEHWAFILGPIIQSIRLPVYRTGFHVKADYPDFCADNEEWCWAEAEGVVINGGRDFEASLRAAVQAAIEERWRQCRGRQSRGRKPRKQPESILGPSTAQEPAFKTWIERSLKDD